MCQHRAGPLRMSPRLQLVALWEAKALGGHDQEGGWELVLQLEG